MYQFSDSDTTDSDDGIRFKTATTRDKHQSKSAMRSRSKSPLPKRERSDRHRRRSKSKSPRRSLDAYKSRRYKRSRSKSVDRLRRHSRSPKAKVSYETRRSYETSRKRSRSTSKERRKVKSSGSRDDPVQANISLDSLSEDDDTDISGLLPTIHKKSGRKSVCGPASSPSLQPEVEEIEVDSESDAECTNVCGPSLPPHLQKSDEKEVQVSSANIDALCGPALPSNLKANEATPETDKEIPPKIETCTPILPPDQQNMKDTSSEVCGPALPPHLLKAKNIPIEETSVSVSIGPFIPEHLRKQLAEQSTDTPEVCINQSEVQEDSKDDEDDCYGPLPPEMQQQSKAHLALEERALQIKLDQLTPQTSNEPIREEWMLELPTVQAANLGLGPRQFRAKAGPDMSDRSSWTDTPGSKKITKKPDKVDLQKEAELMAIRKRDEEQEALVKKEKKKNKRDKSLMQQHQDKLNAKKKEQTAEGATIRRPFNRDTDLKVNQFDDAQKKAIMKKAQLLDDRFSHGQTKYL